MIIEKLLETRTAWIIINKDALVNKQMENSLISSKDKHTILQEAKELIVDLQIMHHISHIHNNCKSKPKDNGPKT
jgi:hypothetical protein